VIEPTLYLATTPTTRSRVPTLFRRTGVRDLLRHPPTLRQPTVGWDLHTLDEPQIVDDHLSVTSPGLKTLSLEPDGALVATAGFPNFLAWPRNEDQFSRDPGLSPWALIELLFNFGLTAVDVAEFIEPRPHALRARAGFRGLQLGAGRMVYLPPPGRFPRDSGHVARSSDTDFKEVVVDITGEREAAAARLGYAMATSIYRSFSFTDDDVPFADADSRALRKEDLLKSLNE
jgi:hypothetical protein